MVIDVVGAAARPQRAHPVAPPHSPAYPSPRHQLLVPLPGIRLKKRPRGVALVLVVDDSLDVREMYAEYLRHRGFSVLTVPDAQQGIEVAVQARPDVVVMDLAMPGMTGTTATRRLKNHPRTWRIPVVILTGHPALAIEEGVIEAGAARLLTKPCLPEDLEQHVFSVLGSQRSARM
jgi:two-component system, cell cycle response regulator DivK